MARLLVLETAGPVFPRIRTVLRTAGHDLCVERGIAATLALGRAWRPHVVLLDLDGGSFVLGRAACRLVRTVREFSGSLVVAVADAVHADWEEELFDSGADDFVCRHRIARTVFRARLEALLRRARARSVEAVVRAGPLRLDPARREVHLHGSPLELTYTQFDLLWRLARDAGRAVPRAHLLATLHNVVEDATSRAVDMHVKGIRRRLGAASFLIQTEYGVGYRLLDDEEVAGCERAARAG